MATQGIDRQALARNGATALLRQIFDHRFFHADPHPGNLLVKRDSTLCFLDFGMVGSIPPYLFDIPVIGAAGLVLAGLIGFGLLFSIIRRRKM